MGFINCEVQGQPLGHQLGHMLGGQSQAEGGKDRLCAEMLQKYDKRQNPATVIRGLGLVIMASLLPSTWWQHVCLLHILEHTRAHTGAKKPLHSGYNGHAFIVYCAIQIR